MQRKVYVETSVVSYLTDRPSRDLVVAAHQQVTAEWWSSQRSRFDLDVSELVLQEASAGDASAAAKRLEEVKGLRSLPINEASLELARTLIVEQVIHERAFYDALHVAIAANQGMDFLLTWNCRHIANAEVVERLESLCLRLGLILPILWHARAIDGRLGVCRIPSWKSCTGCVRSARLISTMIWTQLSRT